MARKKHKNKRSQCRACRAGQCWIKRKTNLVESEIVKESKDKRGQNALDRQLKRATGAVSSSSSSRRSRVLEKITSVGT